MHVALGLLRIHRARRGTHHSRAKLASKKRRDVAAALYFYASEDNSIPTILNNDIINNYESHPQEAWLVELEDAGHFAFSDLCGTHAALTPGCGMAMRQTNPLQRFTYLDAAIVREAMVRYTTAFLERVLLGGPGAALEEASPAAVTLRHHDR